MNLFSNAFPFLRLFQKQAATLAAAVRELAGLFNDFQAAPEYCRRIADLVAAGGLTCREIERELSLTFIAALDREDVRELNRAMEQDFQAVNAIARRLGLYGFRGLEKGAAAMVACLAEMAAGLGPLLEIVAGSGDGAAGRVRLRQLTEEAGSFLLVGLGEVYETAGGQADRLLEAMKWSQIYDRLEETVACLDHTAHVIAGLILKKN